MKEEFLHSLWKLKKFNHKQLSTSKGESLTIIDFGIHNHNAGPDFLNGKIRINNTVWAGHIEIHIKASDWYKHKHDHDLAYDNVILHVVYIHDREVFNTKGHLIPSLEMKDRISTKSIETYSKFRSSLDWIPCARQIQSVDNNRIQLFLDRLFVDRLLNKSTRILDLLNRNKNDWEATMYYLLMKYFGLKVNGEAFESLSSCVPFKLLIKYANNLMQLEALLLGQAGLLHSKDEYIVALKKEYLYLQKKHKLYPMTGVEWRFSKLRPANFPTIRIAQIAALYHNCTSLFNQFILHADLKEIYSFLNVKTSSYWNEHYIPGKKNKYKNKSLGKTTKDILLINVIIPLMYSYAHLISDEKLKEKTIELLYEIPSEQNKIIRKWKENGIISKNAAKSQALIELKSQYCDNYACLNCVIGQQLLFK